MEQQTINFVVALSGVLVGAVLGGGSVLAVVGRVLAHVKNEKSVLDYTEKLYNSIPSDFVKDLIRDGVVIMDKVTDGQDNEGLETQL